MHARIKQFATAAAASALVIGGLTGCSGGAPATGGSDSARKTINIAYSVDQLDAGQTKILGAIEGQVKKVNADTSGPKVVLTVYNAQASVQRQITDVQNAIIKQPQVLLISPVDVVGSQPAIQAASKAGVKVINTRPASLTDIDPGVDVAFSGSNEPAYAKATVDWMKQWLDDNPGKDLVTGLIYGAPAQTPQLIREKAIEDYAKTEPRVKIVAKSFSDWQTATAQKLTQDYLTAHKDINFISCANDAMALGVANALKQTGKTGEVMVGGYDLLPDAVKRVEAGTQTLSISALTKDWANVIDVAVQLEEGKYKKDTYQISNVATVTKDTAAQFIKDNPAQMAD